MAQAPGQSFDVPGIILGKVYANSLMRVLNHRVKAETGYSEPFSTVEPEITTPTARNGLGSLNESPGTHPTFSAGESIRPGPDASDIQSVQKAEEV